MEPPADDLRCKRSDGKQWRCPGPVMEGKTLCEKHVLRAKKSAILAIVKSVFAPTKKSLTEVKSILYICILCGKFKHLLSRMQTKAGPVLVAINPFKDVPLYGNKFIEAYRFKLGDNPHDAAFGAMVRGGVNQSIIIRIQRLPVIQRLLVNCKQKLQQRISS